MRFSIKVKIIVLCSVFLLIFIPSTLFLLINLAQIVKTFRAVFHVSEDVIAKSHELGKLIVDMETGQRGFVITGKEEFLEPYNRANKEFDKVLKHLREDLVDRPEYLDMLERIEHLRFKWIGVAGEPEIEARRLVAKTDVDLRAINQMVLAGTGKQILDTIRVVINAMSSDFRKNDKKDELILITQIGKDVVDSETGQRGFLLAGKDRFLEPYYAGQIAFNKHVKELEKMLQTDKTSLERLSNVKRLYEDWLVKAARPEIHARVKYEKNPRSMDDVASLLAAGTGKKIIDELRELIGGFTSSLTKDVEQGLSKSERRVTRANFISLAISSVGILLSLIIAFILGRSIIGPIRVLIGGTNIIGRGDLTHKIRIRSKDELGVLADSFNKMTEDLQKTTVSRDYVDNIIKSMIDTLIVVGPDGKIKTVNKATSDLLGYKEDELIGKPVATIFVGGEEEVTAFDGTRIKELIGEGSIRDYEMTYKTKSGERIPVSFSGSVMQDKEGKLVGIVGIARDMREIRNMQAMLVQSEKLSALGQLGVGVAHELNSPLTGILSLIRSYMKEKAPNSEEYEGLKEMEGACEHMSKIIKDLSAFARQSTGETVKLNCNEAIESTLSFSAHQLEKQGIKIEKNYDKNLPLVKGDKNQLQQVIINIITNARDAISGKGIFKITTRSKNTDKGQFVEMEFSDTGCGISKENIGKIFDPFFTTKRPGRGIGLGLSITHTIIKNHKGEILVNSELGKGATFTVRLPIMSPVE